MPLIKLIRNLGYCEYCRMAIINKYNPDKINKLKISKINDLHYQIINIRKNNEKIIKK